MRHMIRRNVTVGITAVLAMVGGLTTAAGGVSNASAGASPAADIRQTLGVYPGWGEVETLQAMEDALGYELNTVVQFGGRETPEDFQGSVNGALGGLTSWISARANPLYSVSIPLAFGDADARSEEGIAQVAVNLQQAAGGAFDAYFLAAAESLVAAGVPDAVLRIGHEFDAEWYPWSAHASCEGYANAFRHVVDVFRSVSPTFRIEWTTGMRQFDEYADCAYPGDDYVDIIGMTVFDKGGPMRYFSPSTGTWNDPALVWAEEYLPRIQFHQEFAVAHNKPVAYPEWGLAATDIGAYGGDNPTFVRSMAAWLRSLPAEGPGALAYHAYFLGDNDQFDVRLLPQSWAAFLEEFGAS